MQANPPPGPLGGVTFPPTVAAPERATGLLERITQAQEQAHPPPAAGVPPAVARQQQTELRNARQFAAILRSRQFRDLRFRMNNYFEYHRRGLVAQHELSGEQPWDDALLDPTLAIAPYNPPQRPQDWNDLLNPNGWDDDTFRATQAANTIPFAPPDPGYIRPSSDTADAFVIDLRDRLRARGLDIRSLRHLGAGTTGLATLFEVRSSRMGVRKKFVIKTARGGEHDSLEWERHWLRYLKRAPHIVRGPLLWAEEIFAGAPMTDNAMLFCQGMDARADLLYLEFMKGGTLADLIGKAVAAGTAFPNGVLWKVFFCLVRACVAMQYPPRLYITDDTEEWKWYSETGEDLIERGPDNEHQRAEGSNLVHFDLDPNNVMIGEYDAKHPAVPVFKVGDFSHSAQPDLVTLPDRANLWMSRRAGKRLHLMPEQFHKEWEYVRNLPRDEFIVPKVAGQFSSASNIWAIGMLLHDMITQNLPPDPPAAFGPMNGADATLMPDGIQTFRDVKGNAVDQFYTHGSWLRDADINDNQLKGLLIRCLADQPAHRPTLEELEAYMAKADKILAWDDDPDDREWFEELVNEAPDAVETVDPILDLPITSTMGPPSQDPGLPPCNRMTNRRSSRLAFISTILRTNPWPRRRRAAQAPASPRAAQGGPQGDGSMISQLMNAAGAGLQAISGVWSVAQAPQPLRRRREPPDTSAWLFNSNKDTLYLNAQGLAVLGPAPDASPDPAQAAGERGADRLPLTPPASARRVRRPARPDGAAVPNRAADGAANQPSFGDLLGQLNRGGNASPDSNSNTFLSDGSRSRGWSTASPQDDVLPDIYLVTRDPAGLDVFGQPLGIQEGLVAPVTQDGYIRHVIPIPAFSPGRAPAPPIGAYQYGRATPSSPVIGQAIPVGMFTIRIDPADPAGGPPPNIFYRDVNPFGGPPGGNAAADNNYPQLEDREGQGPWLPRVRAIRIPPYGLFEKPPKRPQGYRYGRRLYLSKAELQCLAKRGVRASPGRKIIRLVHVDSPRGDSWERPTIFYQIQPRARAPKAPSDNDPDPTVLYCTLPDS